MIKIGKEKFQVLQGALPSNVIAIIDAKGHKTGDGGMVISSELESIIADALHIAMQQKQIQREQVILAQSDCCG